MLGEHQHNFPNSKLPFVNSAIDFTSNFKAVLDYCDICSLKFSFATGPDCESLAEDLTET